MGVSNVPPDGEETMDLLKVLKITNVSIGGTSAFGTYSCPEWMASALDSVIAENSPTGQFIRGLVLGSAQQYAYGQEIGDVDTIYLQPENYQMPSLTMFLTQDNTGFGSDFGCGNGAYNAPSFSNSGFSGFQMPSMPTMPTFGFSADPERLERLQRGQSEAAADPAAFFAKYFAKVATVAI